MNKLIDTKMSEWHKQGDVTSMFKFATMLYITAPQSQEDKLDELKDCAEGLASDMNDIELARAKKEIEQLMDQD
jgi:hypothetical protein